MKKLVAKIAIAVVAAMLVGGGLLVMPKEASAKIPLPNVCPETNWEQARCIPYESGDTEICLPMHNDNQYCTGAV